MIDMTERQALNGIYRELREIRKIMEIQANKHSKTMDNIVCLPVYDIAEINRKLAEDRNRAASNETKEE